MHTRFGHVAHVDNQASLFKAKKHIQFQKVETQEFIFSTPRNGSALTSFPILLGRKTKHPWDMVEINSPLNSGTLFFLDKILKATVPPPWIFIWWVDLVWPCFGRIIVLVCISCVYLRVCLFSACFSVKL